MKSPFPGMDPFIEACGLWEEFHGHLIDDMYRYLVGAVPARYVVRTGTRNYLVLASEGLSQTRPFMPDVTISAPDNGSATPSAEGAIAVAEPEAVTMRAYVVEEFTERFVEIQEAGSGNHLVTTIEVLSPSNKRPNTAGWEQYLRKRQALLQERTANLIEIDLLRRGQRMPMADPWPDCPYTLLIARAGRMPLCQVLCAHFRKPLPTIPVPLLKSDPDLPLDLQPMIDAIYGRSKYFLDIDYTRPISPPLSPEETAWLEQQLRVREASA